jgi:hypothetical protein
VLTSQPFHFGHTSLISGVDRFEVINSNEELLAKRTKVLFE